MASDSAALTLKLLNRPVKPDVLDKARAAKLPRVVGEAILNATIKMNNAKHKALPMRSNLNPNHLQYL